MAVRGQVHPRLILTKAGVEDIRSQLQSAPLFKKVLEDTQKEVDAEIANGIEVPVPKDMAGGYTHERHKNNFFVLQKAGNLFQITGEEKYAIYIRDMLLQYAELFPTLELHPTNRSYATGKIFWQCLNDANWLVYTSQAYDCVYDWMSPADRKTVEQNLFRPLADFLSVENPQFFNRIHNHSTWANAAVGMIGLVMDDEELIKRALYGLQKDGLDASLQDNDGGFIKKDGQSQAGFLAQLDFSFSPDGYFTEGPYYLRYAMSPFLMFAKALSNQRPELGIMKYRNGILEKSVFALLKQTDYNGAFFPLNDSQKGMSWTAREVVAAVDIAYADFGRDPGLLSIAKLQGRVQLDQTGFVVAKDLAADKAVPFTPGPIAFTDGPDGNAGGVAILRTPVRNDSELCLVMKYSAQGMGHGHFDKLSYSLYDETGEVIQDYGAARWVNIDQKGGGRYLPENQTWAKQSIAHNTVVVNEISHYEGSVKKGEEHSPVLYHIDLSKKNLQFISAKDMHAYPNTTMHRSMILLEDEQFRFPIVLDLFRIESNTQNQYDLPLWFQGHLLNTNFDLKTETTSLNTLGSSDGYEHLWKEAIGNSEGENAKITWFSNGKFYSMSSVVSSTDDLIMARVGANDPNFNLRPDPGFIIRKKGAKDALFASVVEPHGSYNYSTEIPHNPFSSIDRVEILVDNRNYTAVRVFDIKGVNWTVCISNQNNDLNASHTLEIEGRKVNWQGPVEIQKMK